MAEPAAVALVFTIDELLLLLDDELHGKKSAFSEAQKIRHINKALNELWKALKRLNRNYFVVFSQPTTSGNDDYFPILDTTNLVFNLPKNFAEMRLVEVTLPIDYTTLRFERKDINSEAFQLERFNTNSAPNSPSQASTIFYDIAGPDATGRQYVVLSRLAPIALTLKLWYVRFMPRFTVAKVAGETVAGVPSPYVDNLIVYAAKSLLKSSDPADAAEFATWESEWRRSMELAMPAADTRQSADPEFVEGFGEEA